MSDIGAMPGPWLPGTQMFTDSWTAKGATDDRPLAVPTSTQTMQVTVQAWAYRLPRRPDLNKEWYAINGLMRHGIVHSDMPNGYDPGPNWFSVGYYATHMTLILTLTNPQDGRVYDQGPTSTVGQATTSWNIGAGLSAMIGDLSGVTASVNAGFGQSYSTPAVTTAEATIGNQVRWDISLPGVGFQGDPNPKQPSHAGFEWYFGIIFELPGGAVPEISVEYTTNFKYDWTRGITHDTKDASRSVIWRPSWPAPPPPPAAPPAPPAPQPHAAEPASDGSTPDVPDEDPPDADGADEDFSDADLADADDVGSGESDTTQ